MNRTLARDIVGCLRVSGSPATSIARLRSFRSADWKHALQWLDHSGLALRFWHRLKESGGANAAPSEFGAQLERSLGDHRRRIAAMAREFNLVNGCFESAGLKYAALKGFALIPAYCLLACLRTTYDYDYLLAPEDKRQADQALRAAGYVQKREQVDDPLVYFKRTQPPWSPRSRHDLYSAEFPRTLELHYRVWDVDAVKIHLRLPENPWARVELRSLQTDEVGADGAPPSEPLQFYALGEEDELIFQILHAFRHILQNWCRLASLLDIAWFLEHRSPDVAFWDRFCERIGADQTLAEVVGVVCLLSAKLFGARIPDSLAATTTQNLRSSVALWVSRYGDDLALNNFADSKFSLFLHREFVRDENAWRALKLGSLFPLHRPNQAATPASAQALPRLSAGLRQGLYVVERLKHHIAATARYGIESHRWGRLKESDRVSRAQDRL